MEEVQGLKFVCKLCNKRYPCGKSLGGHMRSHVIANSEEKLEYNLKRWLDEERNYKKESKVEMGGSSISGYGLRENPKKTWRAVDSTTTFPLTQEKICKQCGKGFQSLKAMCGHMACHSEKDRALKDDHSWTSENQKLVMDSHSDTETEDLKFRKRLKSKRYKRIVKSSSFSFANNNNNCSSSVSEIDEQEQEEVAMCLMMLSRDSSNWGGVNSVVESSDNNSAVLETKSSSIDMRMGGREGLSFAYYNGDTQEMKQLRSGKFNSGALDAELVQFEDSDSEYFINGARDSDYEFFINGTKRFESDISIGRFLSKKPNASDDEPGKVKTRLKRYLSEVGKNSIDEKGYDDEGIVLKSLRKRTRDAYFDSEIRNNFDNKLAGHGYGSSDAKVRKNPQKRSKYECLNCKKSFSSHQALGGHRPCHKNVNASSARRSESSDTSVDDDVAADYVPACTRKKATAKEFSGSAGKRARPKKSKGHECPICFRVFKSGQALGGHKRSHFISGPEDQSNQTVVLKQEVPDLLDLNLPAPEEDEAEGNAQFFPW